MTASAFSEDRDSCMAAGMVDHIGKPVAPEALYSQLLRWLPARSPMPEHGIVQRPVPAPARPATVAALAALAAVSGIDTKAGLASLNGKAERYLKLLGKYAEHHGNAAAEIRQTLAAADLATAQRLAHTQKGVAGTLGLSAIRISAAELEQAIRRGENGERLSALAEALANVHRETLCQMQQALSKASDEAADETESSREIIEQLHELLREDDMESLSLAQQARAELSCMLGPDYPAFRQHLDNFDFPQAQLLLEKAQRETPGN